MSKFKPITSDQLRLEGFVDWDKKVRQDVEDFKTELLQRLAVEQLPDALFIRQTIAGAEQQERLRDEGYYPMDPDKARAVLPKKFLAPELEARSAHRLFAEMSEADIVALCGNDKKFFYSHEGENIPIRFERDPSFLLCERLFSPIAAKCFLPQLNFPFLPYSRKFVNVVADGRQKLPKAFNPNCIIDRIPANNAKTRQEIVSRLKANWLPFWNIYTHDALNVNPQNDGVFYRYKILERIDEDSDLMLHQVTGRGKNLEDAKPEKLESPGPLLIKSRSFFDKLVYSEISGQKPAPEIFLDDHRQNHFWYRQFLQSFQLTASDVHMLLAMVFADEAASDRFICESIEPPQPCPAEKYETLQSESGLFTNHLWYLRDNPFAVPGREDLRLVRIKLRYKLEDWDKRRNEDKYLDQDRVNYFAALCSLYMPHGYFCAGELLDAV